MIAERPGSRLLLWLIIAAGLGLLAQFVYRWIVVWRPHFYPLEHLLVIIVLFACALVIAPGIGLGLHTRRGWMLIYSRIFLREIVLASVWVCVLNGILRLCLLGSPPWQESYVLLAAALTPLTFIGLLVGAAGANRRAWRGAPRILHVSGTMLFLPGWFALGGNLVTAAIMLLTDCREAVSYWWEALFARRMQLWTEDTALTRFWRVGFLCLFAGIILLAVARRLAPRPAPAKGGADPASPGAAG